MKNNCCGGINLPSHNNEIEVLIRQLKREVKELMNTTQAKLLCQDKKIAETMVYIKNNLSNYLRDLLDSMLLSGELDEIITEIISNEIALLEEEVEKLKKDIETLSKFPKSNLNYERIGRIINKTPYCDSSNKYVGMQGGTVVNENTYAYISNHMGVNGYVNENSLIKKIDLTTGEVLASKVIEIGHGNGLCYDKFANKYYVACAHGNIVNEDFSNKIIILDDDFNIERTVTTSINFDSLCIDEKGTLYGGVTYKQDPNNGMKIFKLNKTNFSIINTIELENPTGDIGTGQDFAIYNNLIYFLQHDPTSIYVYDLYGKLKLVYDLKTYNQFINVGEVENISSLGNGEFIIGSVLTEYGRLHILEQFFKINTITNLPMTKNYYQTTNMINIYIDNTVTVFNPDGTVEKPYYSIDEIVNNDVKAPITIYLLKESTYPISRINSCDVEIYAQNGGSISCGDSDNSLIIRDSKVYLNSITNLPPINAEVLSNVKIYNCGISPTNYGNLVNSGKGSTVDIERCTFNVSENLSGYLFETNHGLIRWNKNNTYPTAEGKENITKWFNGNFEWIESIPIYGQITKSNPVKVNNGILNCFKQLEIYCSDDSIFHIDTTLGKANQLNYYNLSTSGQGNNVFTNMVVYLGNDGSIELIKCNQITFNSAGTMSVNTNPDIKITSVRGL